MILFSHGLLQYGFMDPKSTVINDGKNNLQGQ